MKGVQSRKTKNQGSTLSKFSFFFAVLCSLFRCRNSQSALNCFEYKYRLNSSVVCFLTKVEIAAHGVQGAMGRPWIHRDWYATTLTSSSNHAARKRCPPPPQNKSQLISQIYNSTIHTLVDTDADQGFAPSKCTVTGCTSCFVSS